MAQNPSLALKYAEINSLRIAYVDQGSGPPVVLVHGMFGDHLDWETVIAPLAAKHRVIVPDLPGFGESAKPDREYTTEFFLSTLHGLLKHLKVRRAAWVGNSFGGQLAILYTLQYPKEVERLVLVSSGGMRPVTDAETKFYADRFSAQFFAGLTPETNQPLFLPVFTRPSEARTRYLDKQNTKLARADYPAYTVVLERSIRTVLTLYLLERLPELRCPTMVLWGDRDAVLPVEHGRKAHAKLTHGTLAELPGCGHMPQLECPQEFLTALEKFLLAERAK